MTVALPSLLDDCYNNKKPLIHKGRKVISWYHPDSYRASKMELVDLRGFEPLTFSMP
jgi:hypothetical protein